MRFLIILVYSFIVPFCLYSQTNPVYSKQGIPEYTNNFPVYPDMFYEYRIAELNKKTPIELVFNESVKHYIELFSIQRHDEFAKIIGLTELYFPIFDEYLDRYHLPFELKYLPVIESGLNPLAISKSGAVGLWQFLINTCKLFDLDVDSYIDERCDPYRSTEAACKYLKYLNNIFNDWQLVLSSYNGGPGDVRKAIARSQGETDYWKIRPFLSEQAQEYVPAFIAAVYLINNYKEHNIVPVKPAFDYRNLDTLMLDYSLYFSQISDITGISSEMLRFLNPVYKTDFIPDLDKPATLVLPSNKVIDFLSNESSILGKVNTKSDYFSMLKDANNLNDKIKIIHVVEKGEFLHKIAMKYNCTPENIKTWNNLPDFAINPGQKLILWIDKEFYEQMQK